VLGRCSFLRKGYAGKTEQAGQEDMQFHEIAPFEK
jgi:hypothetical protein